MTKLYLACLLLLSSTPVFAQSSEQEINHLINSVGKEGCGLVRNKRRYSTFRARSHLQSKWELNASLVHSAEDFIEKIASISVTTGEPYQIKCRGEQSQLAGEWFAQRLQQYRRERASS